MKQDQRKRLAWLGLVGVVVKRLMAVLTVWLGLIGVALIVVGVSALAGWPIGLIVLGVLLVLDRLTERLA